MQTNKRINTDKQELQHTEHYYSNILFILVALGAGEVVFDFVHTIVNDPMAGWMAG